MVAGIAARAPVVVHLHNAERTADGPASPFWSRRLLHTARHVITVSPAVAEYAMRIHPGLTGRVSVVRNGVDPGDFDGVDPERRPSPYLLAVGRLAPQKGFDVLLAALAAATHVPPLVIAGGGPERDVLLTQATRLGIVSRIEFLGDVPRERVKRLLRGAEAVVMPSRFEGNPLIALEAMQAGTPLIASAIPGLPEELRDGATGLLVPPEDPASLARAIDRLLADPTGAQRLGRAAAIAAQAMPTWRAVAARVLGVYEQVAHST
jgi:glycogen(starch) synthase